MLKSCSLSWVLFLSRGRKLNISFDGWRMSLNTIDSSLDICRVLLGFKAVLCLLSIPRFPSSLQPSIRVILNFVWSRNCWDRMWIIGLSGFFSIGVKCRWKSGLWSTSETRRGTPRQSDRVGLDGSSYTIGFKKGIFSSCANLRRLLVNSYAVEGVLISIRPQFHAKDSSWSLEIVCSSGL